jgi:hypothetical protein
VELEAEKEAAAGDGAARWVLCGPRCGSSSHSSSKSSIKSSSENADPCPASPVASFIPHPPSDAASSTAFECSIASNERSDGILLLESATSDFSASPAARRLALLGRGKSLQGAASGNPDALISPGIVKPLPSVAVVVAVAAVAAAADGFFAARRAGGGGGSSRSGPRGCEPRAGAGEQGFRVCPRGTGRASELTIDAGPEAVEAAVEFAVSRGTPDVSMLKKSGAAGGVGLAVSGCDAHNFSTKSCFISGDQKSFGIELRGVLGALFFFDRALLIFPVVSGSGARPA